MIVDFLRQEHRNIEKLLQVLEQELNVFDRGERPDYEVIQAIISYFEVYPAAYHHPQEDKVFNKLKARDPAAAALVRDLAAEHQRGAERLHRVVAAVANVLSGGEMLRQSVDDIIRDFVTHERQHMAMEERDFFPAAIKALHPEDWDEIGATMTDHKNPLFSDAVEQRFDAVRSYILQLEREAEAERA
jgi:hemerythrin-like domain-containing protein